MVVHNKLTVAYSKTFLKWRKNQNLQRMALSANGMCMPTWAWVPHAGWNQPDLLSRTSVEESSVVSILHSGLQKPQALLSCPYSCSSSSSVTVAACTVAALSHFKQPSICFSNLGANQGAGACVSETFPRAERWCMPEEVQAWKSR